MGYIGFRVKSLGLCHRGLVYIRIMEEKMKTMGIT